MQYLNTIANVSHPISYGSFRPLLPSHDGDVKTFSGKAHVYEDHKHIVSRLFSYGIPVAEVVATSEGDKIVVMDYRKIITDESRPKLRWEAVFRHIREFLHEHGYSVETNDDLIPFLVQEEEPSPAPAPAESRVAHWVRNEHPRKPEEAWYTCSNCGKLAVADNGNDVLTNCCPHCGFDMKGEKKVEVVCDSDKKTITAHSCDDEKWFSLSPWIRERHAEMKLAPGSLNIITEFRHIDSKEKLYPIVKLNDGKWYQLREPTRQKIIYILSRDGFFRLVPFGNLTEEEKTLFYEDAVGKGKYSKHILKGGGISIA